MKQLKSKSSAFTMIEMLVAMILLSVGLLGFSAMSVLMIKASRTSSKADESATLAQDAVEDLSAVAWDDLGTDTALPAANGLANADVRSEGPINRNGETEGTGTGPYIYYRYVVVCALAHIAVSPQGNQDPCAEGTTDITAHRPPELACNTAGLSTREKLIRVVVSWHDRNGECRYKATDSLVFQ